MVTAAVSAALMTIGDYLSRTKDLDTRISAEVGRRAANQYKAKYGRTTPHTVPKFVNESVRNVNVYTDTSVIDRACASAVADGVYDETTLLYTKDQPYQDD